MKQQGRSRRKIASALLIKGQIQMKQTEYESAFNVCLLEIRLEEVKSERDNNRSSESKKCEKL